MSHFILMITKDDRTVADAHAVYARLRGTALRYVGFKDIGLPWDELSSLARQIRQDGRELMLEVVSNSRESELASITAAARLGVNYVLGGRHATEAVEILRGSGIRYFPFAGRTVGHPTRLEGSPEEIVDDARALSALPGVHGLDLLAYRFEGDVPALARAVVAAVDKPVIAAGSIHTPQRVQAMRAAGAWAFTVGSALFDGCFSIDPIRSQVDTILNLEGVRP
jgi:hypothetical protein